MTNTENQSLAFIQAPAGVTVTFAQPIIDPFREADFYENGVIAIVTGPLGTVEVTRDGESYLTHEEGEAYRSAEEFRAAFPTGVLPEMDDETYTWTNNGWFDAYTPQDGPLAAFSDGGHLDSVTYNITEAVHDAVRYVSVPGAVGQDAYSEGDLLADKILRDAFRDQD